MKIHYGVALVMIWLSASWGAVAQHPPSVTGNTASPSAVTLSVEFAEERQGGRLTGCGIRFSQMVRDHADRDGGLVLIEGVIAITQASPKLLVTWLKVFPSDVSRGPDGKPRSRPFKPTYAYATIGGLTTAGKERVADVCPAERGFCNGSPSDALLAAMVQLPASRSLVVAYQRHRPGIDVITTINLKPTDLSAEPALDAYENCNGDLLQQFTAGSR
jgi:hypothetical protein